MIRYDMKYNRLIVDSKEVNFRENDYIVMQMSEFDGYILLLPTQRPPSQIGTNTPPQIRTVYR